MENKNTLNITMRTELKRRPNIKLRKEGKIPAVVYGVKDPIYVAVDESEFEAKYHRASENIIIALMLDGKEKCHVLIKDYQDDIISGKIQHIDFFEVDTAKELKVNIPVRLIGAPVGVKAGGVLEQLVHAIEVQCLPKDIPTQITLNVDNLDVNQSIHVKDIAAIPGVKFNIDAEEVVAHVVYVKVEAAPAAAPAAATTTEAAPAADKAAADKENK